MTSVQQAVPSGFQPGEIFTFYMFVFTLTFTLAVVVYYKCYSTKRHFWVIRTTENCDTEANTSTAGGRSADGGSSDYRVAVFGAGGVGKSSIVQRFIKGTFTDSYVPTIEDTYRQVISCNQKNVCTLQITDTTGSHQFPAMQRLSISKGHAFILIYSITSKQSLEELGPIVLMLKEVKGAAISEVPIMLVGNKKDEESKREVSTGLGEKLAGNWGTGFIETSAKNNENITELFQNLLAMEKKRQLALTSDETEGKNGKKKGCSLM